MFGRKLLRGNALRHQSDFRGDAVCVYDGNYHGRQVMNGADILVKSLVDHGVEVLFAYPGGCSMPMHQALTRYANQIRTILPRHEQGGGFAAQGYARSTGKVGSLHGDQRSGGHQSGHRASPTPSWTASRCWRSPARWPPR